MKTLSYYSSQGKKLCLRLLLIRSFKCASQIISHSPANLNENLDNKLTESNSINQSELLQDIIAEKNHKNAKNYKKFEFFYRRTAFRSMTEFYKGLFKPNLD